MFFVPWLHLMGELSAKPTEGEKLVCRTKKQWDSIGTLSLLPPAFGRHLPHQRKAELTLVPWLHLMGELSAKPTEGENPVCRTKKPAEFDRYVISPSVKTFGFATFLIRGRQGTRPPDISFDAFDLWVSKRESAIHPNRTETKNPCLLNQWRQGFVFASAAATGVELPQLITRGSWLQRQNLPCGRPHELRNEVLLRTRWG